MFFSLFSLLWQLEFTIVLFVCCLSNQTCLSYLNILSLTWLRDSRILGLAWMANPSNVPGKHARPMRLGLLDTCAWVCQLVFGSKNLKFFKRTIRLQKQIVPYSNKIFHSYAIEFNSKLFFICAIYFINVSYLKRKEWKKMLSFKWFISSLKK